MPGSTRTWDVYSFHMSRSQSSDTGLMDRLQRITQSVMKRNKIVVRPIDRKRLRQEFELFKELYKRSLGQKLGLCADDTTRTGCDGREPGPVF